MVLMEAYHSRVNIPSIFNDFPSINSLNGSHFKDFLLILLSSILLVDMAIFSNLEILDLSGNFFTGSITPYIGVLSSLKAISLSYNIGLNGTLNTSGKNLLWNRAFTILIRSVMTIERE